MCKSQLSSLPSLSLTQSRVPSRAFTIPMDHPAPQTPTARAEHCHSTHLCARPSCACSADTHFPYAHPNFIRTAIELSSDLANDWRHAHLWTESFPMVPGLLGLVAVEGTAFRSEVAEACLGVGVRPVPPRAMFTPMLCTLTCIQSVTPIKKMPHQENPPWIIQRKFKKTRF